MQQHFNDSLSEHYTMVAEQSQSVHAQLREANLTTHKQKEKIVNELDNAQISTKIAEASTISALKHALEGVEREYIEL